MTACDDGCGATWRSLASLCERSFAPKFRAVAGDIDNFNAAFSSATTTFLKGSSTGSWCVFGRGGATSWRVVSSGSTV